MSFEKFWDEHSSQIFRYCCRLTKDMDDAEDIRSNVYLRARKNFDKLHTPGAAKAWLYQVARTVYLDHKRNRWNRRVPLRVTCEVAGGHHQEMDDDYDGLLATIGIDTEVIHEVIDASRMLRESDKRLMGLRALGYTDDESAQMEGVKTCCVKSRVHRAQRIMNGRPAR